MEFPKHFGLNEDDRIIDLGSKEEFAEPAIDEGVRQIINIADLALLTLPNKNDDGSAWSTVDPQALSELSKNTLRFLNINLGSGEAKLHICQGSQEGLALISLAVDDRRTFFVFDKLKGSVHGYYQTREIGGQAWLNTKKPKRDALDRDFAAIMRVASRIVDKSINRSSSS